MRRTCPCRQMEGIGATASAVAAALGLVRFPPHLRSMSLSYNDMTGVFACCCPCVVYAQNKQRLEYLNSKGVPDPKHGGGCCSCDCWVHGLITGFCGLGWIMQVCTIPPSLVSLYLSDVSKLARSACKHSFTLRHQGRRMWRLLFDLLVHRLRVDPGEPRN
jgi:hypothetical protein